MGRSKSGHIRKMVTSSREFACDPQVYYGDIAKGLVNFSERSGSCGSYGSYGRYWPTCSLIYKEIQMGVGKKWSLSKGGHIFRVVTFQGSTVNIN